MTTPLPDDDRAAGAATTANPRRLLGLPWIAWVIALCAAVAHIAPFWRAELSQRGEWTFEENLTISPDQMQYRVWLRQTQREGPVITNRFTTEPNRAHLPVYFFWAVGKAGRAVGTTPERAYAYAGSVLAILLTLMVYATVRRFIADPTQRLWVVVPLMVAGGLGGHIKVLQQIPALAASSTFQRFLLEPIELFPVFEDYRSHYLVKVLLDTHSIALWIVGLGAVLALHSAITRLTPARIAAAMGMFVLMTVMHVYEGITLLAIAWGVALCCWPMIPDRRRLVGLLAGCTLAVGVCYAVLGALYARSGLPLPDWRAINILVSTLLIAYPISWALIAWGGLARWRIGGLRERFLFGWILGCTIVTLSGPFFPYPDRGTMTMQVPLAILGAIAYFAKWPRVSARHAAILALVGGAAPLWLAARTWHFSGFRTDAPFQYVNPSHRAARDALRASADTSQILLADVPDLLWLAPTFPGRLYVGHFFLTVNFTSKVAALREALANPSLMPALLETSRADYLFVNGTHDPARFAFLPGLVPLAREPVGWLFRVERSAQASSASRTRAPGPIFTTPNMTSAAP
ncbi:MAG: hypothetical protein IT361_01085 [Gemmatimonadaceae bacterium]|nr:hypothetical protein [Gemmatimonadaceae bacterium]